MEQQRSSKNEEMILHDSSLKNTLEIISKNDVEVIEKGLSMQQCTDSAKIFTQVKLHGELKVKIALVKLLLRLQENINSTRQLNAEQMKVIASDMIETYPMESIEDFALCFKMARRNEFTNSFGTIDSTVINIWFREYLERKAIDRENRAHLKEIGERKSGLKPSAALKKLVEATRIDKPRVNVKRISLEEDYQRIKDVIENYHPQYDEGKLRRLRSSLQNNDTYDQKNYGSLIKMINDKLEIKNTSE